MSTSSTTPSSQQEMEPIEMSDLSEGSSKTSSVDLKQQISSTPSGDDVERVSDDAVKDRNRSSWATINVLGKNEMYPGQKNNEVKTTRYNAFSFIPLSFLEQFRILSNVYFTIVLIITFLPWSPVHWAFQLAPMMVVFIVSMARAGIEDLMKHKEDKKQNNLPVMAYRNHEWVNIPAKDLVVGDIVKLTDDTHVIADMLFVDSNQDQQLCYYSETNLNGETAVKAMQCHPAFIGQNVIEYLTQNTWSIDLMEPDRELTKFDARLRKGSEFWPISVSNVLLRGVSTHYTDDIICVVLRTGHDTKIMKNIKHPPAKLTAFDRNLNRMLIIIFVFKICLVFICTFIGVHFDEGKKNFKLLQQLYPGYGESFLQFFVQYFILYSYMFPISLTVTIELIRLYHKIIMNFDAEMDDLEFDHARAHNSNVIGQLGLITHILTDKTGTLTENIMELLKFGTDCGIFDADNFLKGLELNPQSITSSLPLLLAMAVCNNVIVHKKHDGTLEYNSDSPDESAFVAFAAKCNVKLIERGLTAIKINVCGIEKEYKILAVLPFNSDRKRMSVLVQSGSDPAILYCKGADNVISERSQGTFEYQDVVDDFASTGLRTLVFTSKEIKDDELLPWLQNYREAEASLQNRDIRVADCAEQIENGLVTIGVSGVEDRLQPNVPESIAWMRDAGIKIWVLTGDKLETAIAIGKTSGVIIPKSEMIIISSDDSDVVGSKLHEVLNNFSTFRQPVLIVTAHAVEHAMNNHLKTFMQVADQCTAVILCRVSPYMKASITSHVRECGAMTLAIGDGANDVGMIQVAHCGIGVYGREGSQAAHSSDIAIPRFRHLCRLLGVYGHWAYRRFATVAVYMIYKNFVFIVVQLWFAIDTLFSPTSYYNDFLMSCFNLIFTVLPPFIFGFWDQDLPQDTLLDHPKLYKIEYDPMNPLHLIYYLIISVWQSLCSYYTVTLCLPNESLTEDGTISYFIAIYICIFQIIVWGNYFDVCSFIFYGINIFLALAIILLYCAFFNYQLTKIIENTLRHGAVWFVWIIGVLAGLLPGYLYDTIKRHFVPTPVRIYEERNYKNKNSKVVEEVEGEKKRSSQIEANTSDSEEEEKQ